MNCNWCDNGPNAQKVRKYVWHSPKKQCNLDSNMDMKLDRKAEECDTKKKKSPPVGNTSAMETQADLFHQLPSVHMGFPKELQRMIAQRHFIFVTDR